MSIDWDRAQKFPQKKQKVLSNYLLDLRERINNLERRIAAKNNELKEKNQKKSNNKKKLEEEIKNLIILKSDLRIKLSNSMIKVSVLEKTIEELTKKNLDLEKTILDRNGVIESLEEDFEKRLREIEGYKKKIEDLNNQLNKSSAHKLLKKVQNTMLQKGFISDKEFFKMVHKIEEKYTKINI